MEAYHNVRALQIELWENCTNNCTFCYTKVGRITSTPQKQLEAIRYANTLLDSLSSEFEAFGLIGGEFFQGQLSTPELLHDFKALISRLDNLVTVGRLKQVWVTASLIGDLSEFKCCLEPVVNKSHFFICTSYDTYGRFKSSQDKAQWFTNLAEVQGMGFTTHTQVICTQAFIDEALSNDIVERISKLSMFDFKCPGPFRAEYINYKGVRTKEWYRALLNNCRDKFDNDFFITDRNSFFKFLLKIKELFGPEKLAAFCSNEVRSDVVHLFPSGEIIDDRWGSAKENAPCGHPWDSFCYINSEACARCDAQRLIDE